MVPPCGVIPKFSWNPVGATKGGCKHYMLKEIHEQPQALTDTIDGRLDFERAQVRLDQLNLPDSELAGIERIQIIATGTSWHAGLVGKFLIEKLAKLPVDVEYGSEFRYREPLLAPDTVVLAITQSGETADVLTPMEQALDRGQRTLVICNTPGSRAAKIAHGVLFSRCGPEVGVASTKSFTGQLACLHMLGLFMGLRRGVLSPEEARVQMDELSGLPERIATVLGRAVEYERLAATYFKVRDFL